MDSLFKRVAVDFIGPIYLASAEGHRCILTLVDFVTRYPEAKSLKGIGTEAVAETLVSLYCHLGITEGICSDLGSQFVSECMQEVSRLLSIQQITTMPYHLMGNGLVENLTIH